MKVLLVGGSGHLGTLLAPYLRAEHQRRVLDVQPPRHHDVEYVEGSIADQAALERALDGMDTFITMVMKGPQDGDSTVQDSASRHGPRVDPDFSRRPVAVIPLSPTL